MTETLRVVTDGRGVATMTMNRPEVRNAFDERLMTELADAITRIADDDGVRVLVLTGSGSAFSAGADLEWMRAMKDYSFDENVRDTSRVNTMLRALWDLPKPVIGRVNGHAMGGGTGLVATCDVAVAADTAKFGFTEVSLGLAPAVISPYVVRKIGPSAARALFVTGERFDAHRAKAVGLVHEVVAPDDLDEALETVVGRCLAAGPKAIAAAKQLVDLAMRPLDEAAAETPKVIAALRVGEEGQEGMQAFFDRRRPAWSYG